MDPNTLENPWVELERLIASGEQGALDQFLHELNPADTARAISRLSEESRTKLLELLSPQKAADVVEEISQAQAAEIFDDLEPARAAAIIEKLDSDDQADLLSELHAEKTEAIFKALQPEHAENLRQLIAYPADTAGGMMITEFLAFPDTMTAGDVLDALRENTEKYSDFEVQYVYILNGAGALSGVLRIRDLLFSPKSKPVTRLMITKPVSVPHTLPLHELRQFFDEYAFLGVPVVDENRRLLGVIKRTAVSQALEQQSNKIFLLFSGIIGGEELRSSPTFARSSKRLSWLTVNIFLNIIAASVIAVYQDTLSQVIALAVFLPIISDMSGCSGNQAVAVSMRELATGLARPRDVFNVLLKEIPVGLFNGLMLGLMIGVIALIWKGNPWLGLVVGAAMAMNTLVSVCFGGIVPLVLRSVKLDPALVSSPMLTTITDMCGFFFVLSLASLLLPQLTS